MDIKAIVKDVAVIPDTYTFIETLDAMENRKTNTLLVTDEDGRLCGEVTVANLLEVIIPDTLNGDEIMVRFSSDKGLKDGIKNALEVPVADFMSYDISPIEMEDNMLTVIATALTHQRTRIPVVDKDGRPVGIISRQGLKHIIKKFADA